MSESESKLAAACGEVWADFIKSATHISNPRPFTNREVMQLLNDVAQRAYEIGVEDMRKAASDVILGKVAAL